jgi:hypothetical protein
MAGDTILKSLGNLLYLVLGALILVPLSPVLIAYMLYVSLVVQKRPAASAHRHG